MASSTARVGVIIRTRHRPWFLERALQDVSAQTYTDWIVHIVNDGGPEADVEAILAGLSAEQRSRIAVTHHRESHGRSAAANVGVNGVTTEFVVLHDDDDLWHPQFLAHTVEHLDSHPDDIGVMVRTEIVYEAQRGVGFAEVGRAAFWPQLSEISYTDFLQVNRAVPISYLYRRRLHDEIGLYREDLHAVEDWEFNLRTTLDHHIGFIARPTLAYWMQRVGVEGELGNSMFTLGHQHEQYDRLVRDEALRAWVRDNGAGLPLYLTRFVQDEVARQLDARLTLGQRAAEIAKRLRHRRRTG